MNPAIVKQTALGSGSFVVTCAHFETPPGRRSPPKPHPDLQHLTGFGWLFHYPAIMTAKYAVERQRFRAECEAETKRFHAVAWRWVDRAGDAEGGRANLYYDIPTSQLSEAPLPARPTSGAPIVITPTAGPATLIQASAVAPSAANPARETSSVASTPEPARAAPPAGFSRRNGQTQPGATSVQSSKRTTGATALDKMRQGSVPATIRTPPVSTPASTNAKASTIVPPRPTSGRPDPASSLSAFPCSTTAGSTLTSSKAAKPPCLPGREVRRLADGTTLFQWEVIYPLDAGVGRPVERAEFLASCEAQVARWGARDFRWTNHHELSNLGGAMLTFAVPTEQITMQLAEGQPVASRKPVAATSTGSHSIQPPTFPAPPGAMKRTSYGPGGVTTFQYKPRHDPGYMNVPGWRETYRKLFEAELGRWGAFDFEWRKKPNFRVTYKVPTKRVRNKPPPLPLTVAGETDAPSGVAAETVEHPAEVDERAVVEDTAGDGQLDDEPEDQPEVEEIELPAACQSGENKDRARDKFQTKQLRRLMTEGKLLRSIAWTDTKLLITYTTGDDSDSDFDYGIDDDGNDTPHDQPIAQPARVATPPARLPLFAPRAPTPTQEDRKPRVVRSPSLEISGYEPARGPVQRNLGELPRFPVGIRGNSSDDQGDVNKHALEFINTFFPKFDSNRQTLVDLYTQDALFSLVGEATEPAQLVHARPRPLTIPIPASIPKRFERVWHTSAQIINAFKQIPPGSHERKKIRYDAHALPELADWPGAKRPPILIHVQAEFEHFPEKVRRRISRVFVLVPKDVRRGGGACPIEYQIKSDQLTFGYFVPNKQGRMDSVATIEGEWRRAQAAVPVPSPPRVATAARRDPVVAGSPAADRSAPLAVQPAPVPTPVPMAAPAAVSNTAASRSASLSQSESDDDDFMIIEQLSQNARPQPTRRRTPSPSPSPPPAPPHAPAPAVSAPTLVTPAATSSTPAVRSKKSSKRRASSPAGPPRAAPDSTTRSRIEADSVAAVAQSAGVPADVFTPAQQAAVEALIQQRLSAAWGAQLPRDPAVPPPSASSRVASRAIAPTSPIASSSPVVAPIPLAAGGRPAQHGGLIRTGSTTYFTHGYTGTGNKMRELYSLGELGGYLALSSLGDVVRWDGKSKEVKRVSSGAENNKVDTGDYSAARQTLVVGFLGLPAGAPGTSDNMQARRPAHQVSLVQLSKTILPGQSERAWTRIPVNESPHATGVTTLAVQPGAANKRLKWVTGGEDKDFFHWTWHSSSKTAQIDRLRIGHTSAPADLSFTSDGAFILSAGNDKRVICFDLREEKARWTATLEQRAVMVSAVPDSSQLVVSRQGLASSQFTLHDLRTRAPAAKFGFDVPFTRNAQGVMVQQNLGRYLRGDWRGTLFVHPDGRQGVHLWDLRALRGREGAGPLQGDLSGEVVGQAVPGVGSTRVVHSMWANEGGLALLGQHGIAKVGVSQFY